MTKTLDLKELAEKNPKVDLKMLNETLLVVRELRKQGVVREKRYDLNLPFSTRLKHSECFYRAPKRD